MASVTNDLDVRDASVQIITSDDASRSFILHEDNLSRILLDPNIKDKKVAVISVAGAFRKGKSFLLNFFLRYFQRHDQADRWLGSNEESLAGFSWKGGSDRVTSGILLWSEPFIMRNRNGEDVVVLLMDTQGAFDSQSTVKDCATVFALSTMLSSVQIYNVTQNLQEDDLQHLQLFAEYGRLALEKSTETPFQSLLFLVRDWTYPYEAEYGFEGGARTLEKRLTVSDSQHPQLQQLRHHIRSSFNKIECFLMPHPGLFVATNPKFDGKLSDIDAEFKTSLMKLVPRLVAPEHVCVKEINGKEITALELFQYFKAYTKIFQGEELPEPKTMLEATAEANNLAAVATAKDMYWKLMEEQCGGDTPYMNEKDLVVLHEDCRTQALEYFVDTPKMGGVEFSEDFLKKLDEDIGVSYDDLSKMNKAKNLFHAFKTPTVLVILFLIDYIIKEICEYIYLDFLARILNSFLIIIMLAIATWSYVRYSGNMREIGQAIDDLTAWIYETVLQPAYSICVQQGVKHAADIQRLRSNTTTSVSGPKPSRGFSTTAYKKGS